MNQKKKIFVGCTPESHLVQSHTLSGTTVLTVSAENCLDKSRRNYKEENSTMVDVSSKKSI